MLQSRTPPTTLSDLPPAARSLVDRCVERNARLLVRLTHAQREAHAASHDRHVHWAKCAEPSCRLTRQVIEQSTLEEGGA